MKICIVAEGSYPYRTGGVSSWIQMLVSSLREHEFIIFAIGAQKKDRGSFSYTLPENITKVKEVFLDEAFVEKGRRGRRIHAGALEREALCNMLLGRAADWKILFRFLRSDDFTTSELLASKDFFDVLREAYEAAFKTLPFTDFFWSVRSMIIPLVHVIRQEIPLVDLCHSVSTGYAGMVGSMWRALYGKPFILTEHGIYTREREEEIIKADWIKGSFKDIWTEHFHSLSRCAYDFADRVITIFERNREIQIELGCEKEKTLVVANGIQVDRYSDRPQKSDPDGSINVGAIVRIVPIKDIKTMIHGFAIAGELYPRCRFFIMGPTDEEPEYYEECKQLVDSLALDNILFTGRVNIAEYVGQMDILVLSSISEGQPLAVLEGMAGGKPHVTTDVGNCRDLLYGSGDGLGEAGVVVPVMDYQKLGETIAGLCMDAGKRERMGIAARNRVSKLYTVDRLIGAYKKIYDVYEV